MQEDGMRHDGGAKNASTEENAAGAHVRDDRVIADQSPVWAVDNGLDDITDGDDANQRADECLDTSHTMSLQRDDGDGGHPSEKGADKERYMKEQVEAEGAAKELSQVGGNRG